MAIPKPALFAGPDSIGLFKSLKNLKGSELRYALGYNMSTLRMFGVPMAGLVSLPYDIQQTLNTVKRLSTSVKTGSIRPTSRRAQTLGFAKQVIPKARGLVPKTGVGMIDRYSSIYFGRQSAGAIRAINRGKGKKEAFKAMFNPEVIDREILKQGMVPRKDNVLHNWQMGTYMRAATGAPDPIRNNPFVQAQQFAQQNAGKRIHKFDARQGVVDSKGEHLMMTNDRFEEIMGSIVDSRFNPEANVKGTVDAMMMDYMESAIMKESAHLHSHVRAVKRESTRDYRRNAMRSMYRQSGLNTADGVVGNEYYLGGPKASQFGIEETRYRGDLRGFSNRKIDKSVSDVFVKDGGVNMDDFMADQRNIGKLSTKAAVAANDPKFAKEVNKLTAALNLPPITKGANANMQMLGLISALKNVGMSGSLAGSNLQGEAARGVNSLTSEAQALVAFAKNVNGLGYKNIASSVAGLLVNPDVIDAQGVSGGLKAFEKVQRLANTGEGDAAMKGALRSLGINNPDVEMVGLHSKRGDAMDIMQGEVLNQRSQIANDLTRYRLAGGGIIVPGTGERMNAKFYDPSIQGAVDPMQFAFKQWNDELGREELRWYRSHASLNYASNRSHYRKGNAGDMMQAPLGIDAIIHKNQEEISKLMQTFGHTGLDGESDKRAWRIAHDKKIRAKQLENDKLIRRRAEMKKDGSYYSQPNETAEFGYTGGGGVDKSYEYRWTNQKYKRDIHQLSKYGEDQLGWAMNTAAIQYRNERDFPSSWANPKSGSFEPDMNNIKFVNGKRLHPNTKLLAPSTEAERTRQRKRAMGNRESNNFIPDKKDIVQSIHIVPLNSKDARGSNFILKAAVVVGVSAPKTEMLADAVRDIAAIEYGGPATDSKGGYSMRSDGMFYLPSFFFTRAASETAAYLGLGSGAQFKSFEKTLGRDITVSMTSKNPDVKRLSMKDREKQRTDKKHRGGMAQMIIAQQVFLRSQRQRGRKMQGNNFRLQNRRALNAFQDTAESTYGPHELDSGFDPTGNDARYIDAESLFQKDTSADRWLHRTVEGFGNREFKMTSLGPVNRKISTAGLGAAGFARNTVTGKHFEVKPASFADVWQVDGQSLVGRMPYVPVFDPMIYRQLIANNAHREAKNYLKGAQHITGAKGYEYILDGRDVRRYTDLAISGGLDSKRTIDGLTKMLQHPDGVRAGIRLAANINATNFLDVQAVVYGTGVNAARHTELRAFMQLFGNRTQLQANLTASYMAIIEDNMKEIFVDMGHVQKMYAEQVLKVYAGRVAGKMAGSIETMLSRTMIGDIFNSPEEVLNTIERIAVMMETGMAAIGDKTQIIRDLYRYALRTDNKMRVISQMENPQVVRRIFSVTRAKKMNTEEIIQTEKIFTFDGNTNATDLFFSKIQKQGGELTDVDHETMAAIGLTLDEVQTKYTTGGIKESAAGTTLKLGDAYTQVEIDAFVDEIFNKDPENLFHSTKEIIENEFRLSQREGIWYKGWTDYIAKQTPQSLGDISRVSIDARKRDKGSGQPLYDASKPRKVEQVSTKFENFAKFALKGKHVSGSWRSLEAMSSIEITKEFYNKKYHTLLENTSILNQQTRKDIAEGKSIFKVSDSQMEELIGVMLSKIRDPDKRRALMNDLITKGLSPVGGTQGKRRFVEWLLSNANSSVNVFQFDESGKAANIKRDQLQSLVDYYINFNY